MVVIDERILEGVIMDSRSFTEEEMLKIVYLT